MTLTEAAALGAQIAGYAWTGLDYPVLWLDNYSVLDIVLAYLAWNMVWKFLKRMINANRETISNRIKKNRNSNIYKDTIKKGG